MLCVDVDAVQHRGAVGGAQPRLKKACRHSLLGFAPPRPTATKSAWTRSWDATTRTVISESRDCRCRASDAQLILITNNLGGFPSRYFPRRVTYLKLSAELPLSIETAAHASRLRSSLETMNNEQFRRLVLENPKPLSSSANAATPAAAAGRKDGAPGGATPGPVLGSRMRSSIPMTPYVGPSISFFFSFYFIFSSEGLVLLTCLSVE